jgi:hypothetical protein
VFRWLLPASCILSLTACVGDGRVDIEGEAGSEAATHDSGEDEGIDPGERLDVGTPVEPEPCSKVDILFVIDDSTSMQDEQDALIAAFPQFVGDIESQLSTVASYHVGVVTTDTYHHNSPGCTGLGDLVTQTGGEGSSEEDCAPFASGLRYIDESEPDLAEKFACAAQVGLRGMPGEAQVGAVLGAVNPVNGLPKNCNMGFVRPDALLVVVLISDEDDKPACYPSGCVGGTPGTPEGWFEELVALKGGVEENVVMLSIVGGPGAFWDCGVEEAPNIIDFTQRFTHGSVGDICHMDLGQYFSQAIDIVSDGCAGFTPQG